MTTAYQRERRRVALALQEARDFMSRAQEFLDANIGEVDASPKRSAMRRQSMELTRALVGVRKSGYQGD